MPVSSKSRVKPLLIGESNPYGGDPYFALYPAPDGCSGHRLCCLILGMRRADYMSEFERVNLCPHVWNLPEAREAVTELCQRVGYGSLILLGAKVCGAFGVKFTPFESTRISSRHQAIVLPHPSGLSRSWNEPGAFERARELVARSVPSIAHLLGVSDDGDEEVDARLTTITYL